MPVSRVNQEFELMTRNANTKVEAKISLEINGREIPNLAVLGDAVEKAIAIVQAQVTESYKAVPERV